MPLKLERLSIAKVKSSFSRPDHNCFLKTSLEFINSVFNPFKRVGFIIFGQCAPDYIVFAVRTRALRLNLLKKRVKDIHEFVRKVSFNTNFDDVVWNLAFFLQ